MAEKKVVQDIFNDIAPKYDLLNHLLSMNVDKRWRRRAMKLLDACDKESLLDVACGTGDFSIAAHKAGVKHVTGIDISEKMVEIGRKKISALELENSIELYCGDAEKMLFADNSFDAVTVAFGVRNFENLKIGLTEMNRVLRPGGKIVILEFSMPQTFPMRQLYLFYFRCILPLIGGWISGNRGAYTYLPDSVMKFPQGEKFLAIMTACGFKKVTCTPLTFGIASLYMGFK